MKAGKCWFLKIYFYCKNMSRCYFRSWNYVRDKICGSKRLWKQNNEGADEGRNEFRLPMFVDRGASCDLGKQQGSSDRGCFVSDDSPGDLGETATKIENCCLAAMTLRNCNNTWYIVRSISGKDASDCCLNVWKVQQLCVFTSRFIVAMT